ncbi:MAG: zinc ribbon domain-containing protein [Chloroflexi bacterium]|nr:zinc ribbon domain-containing protein [Chloroflexota bacterium]
MPLYEYVCPTCHAKFERLRPMGQGESSPCPDCGTMAGRVLSVFASVRSGSGPSGELSMGGGGGHGCGGGCASCAA